MNKKFKMIFILCWWCSHLNAAVSTDRTRIIYNENERNVIVTLSNNNKERPYLAQIWLEDASGNKMNNGMLQASPPLQRIEGNSKGAIRLNALKAKISENNIETLFYLNIREIPSIGKLENTVTLAFQTRLKVFYRPAKLRISHDELFSKVISHLKICNTSGIWSISNPTPYYVTIINVKTKEGKVRDTPSRPIMLEPFGTRPLDKNIIFKSEIVEVNSISDFGRKIKFFLSYKNGMCYVQ